ncbi:tetratricopeptide repeat protein [Streptomyces sp. NPDC057137]|uniref:tetratricopeptide repeat protein n=1 Tax=Streptomyces sp. NPDC057137 TaxID=3346030 RepID=UPI003644020F
MRRPSRQEINRRGESAGFVGRRGELAVFRETFARNPEEVDFPYLFHVHGNGGVGKSTLVHQWEATAREQTSVVTAFVDDEVHDALEAMETVSDRLGRQGHPLKKFDKQLATYRQRRHQAESTAPAQQPAAGEAGAGEAGAGEPTPASPSSTVAAQLGLAGLGMLPVVGAFAGAMDPGQVALGADRMRAMLNTRLRNHDDVQLVMKPLAGLTPVFLEELAEVAERCERVVLFFDVYERTGPVLDAWLQSIIFTEDHGTLPVNAQIVLSGRSQLEPRVWGDHLGQVVEVGLDVFTEDEARTLLATRGVTSEQNVELVLRLSGRLPLLVDMLASGGQNADETVIDRSETAVERFLKWEPDAERRKAARACALPLQLDEDIYRVAAPDSTADGYPWLRALAFVSHQAGRCRYHDVVRDTMLRLQRTQSPTRWQRQHTRLADAFEQWRRAVEAGLGTDTDACWDDATWREHRLNETYHRLCAAPRTALPDALLQTIHAIDHDLATLRRWAQVLGQAGHDADSPVLITWGQRLETTAEQDGAGIAVLTALLTAPELGTEARALARLVRARDHRFAGDYDAALADYAAAQRLAPDSSRLYAGRGETYRLTGRYEEALADLDRAIEINPNHAWDIASRGETYRLMGRYDDALTDFNRAIELNPNHAWTAAKRGQTYQSLGRRDEAITDFSRAIELNPNYMWAITSRGEIYRETGRHEDALTDFNRAIELDPQADWAIANRGLAYQSLGRHEEAITDFSRAIELNPDYDGAIASRGFAYQSLGRHEEAITDFTRAIELDPQADWAIAGRGATCWSLRRYDEAITDLTRAIELDPDYTRAIATRGLTFHSLGRHEEALTDLTRAIELDPDYTGAIATRGLTFHSLSRHEEALTDLTRAIELDPDYTGAIANRGFAYQSLGRHEEALTDLTRAIELNPQADLALANRGESYRSLGRYDEALTDLTRAIELDPDYAWAIAKRGQTLASLERHDEALTELTHAIELNPQAAWIICGRGEIYRLMGRYDEALTDLNSAIEVNPDYAWAIAGRGQTYQSLNRHDEALADFTHVIEIEPTNGWARYERALTLHASGRGDGGPDLVRAIECFTRDAQEPGDRGVNGRGNLVVGLCAVARWEEAEDALSAFLESPPPRSDVVDLIADLDQLTRMTASNHEPVTRYRSRLVQALGGT